MMKALCATSLYLLLACLTSVNALNHTTEGDILKNIGTNECVSTNGIAGTPLFMSVVTLVASQS